MENELLNLILQDFPESLVYTLACFALLKLRFEWKKIFIIAILQTITNLVSLLPIAFGMHTIILFISLTIYIRIFTGLSLLNIFTANTILLLITEVLEIIYLKPLLDITHLSYEYTVSVPILREAFSLPYELALLVLALFLNYRNKKLGRFVLSQNRSL
jgi:hypothetical protein